jgi:transcriptional regulator with XRE-family HTH domain
MPHFRSVKQVDTPKDASARVRPVEPVYARFGRELQRLRRQRKLSQAALAQLIDPSGERFSRSTVAMIEGGRQRVALHVFLELARALEVEPGELLRHETKQVPELAMHVRDLPAPEQEWVNRIFSSTVRKPRSKVHGTPA